MQKYILKKDGDFFISDWLRNRNTVEFWVFGKEFIIQILKEPYK